MNTTGLIAEWSMDGGHGILVGGFRSVLDIHAIVEARGATPIGDAGAPTPATLLLKPAGGEDWEPLLLADSA